jgi:conjugal transfer pilus assembly protein TraK
MLILTTPSFAVAADPPAPPQQLLNSASPPEAIKYPLSSQPQIKYPSPQTANVLGKADKAPVSMFPSEGYAEQGTMPEMGNNLPGIPLDDSTNIQTVPPETPSPVIMSNSDVNRVSCGDSIVDALSSEEKGLIIKVVGKDAFLKFKVLKTPEGKIKYSQTPTEVFIVCGDSTYNLVAYPKKVPSKTVHLGSGTKNRIKANQSIFASLPFEKKIMRAIKDVYTEQMPDSYQVTKVNETVGNYKEFSVRHHRSIQIEGEGLTIYEFELQLKPGQAEFKLNDKIFVNKKFSSNIVAICPERQILYPGETTRLFIVEQRGEKASAGMLSIKTLDEDENPIKTERARNIPAPDADTQKLVKEEVRQHEN